MCTEKEQELINKIVYNKHDNIRVKAAYDGIGLDVLVHDTHWRVREEVAKRGYGLDILVKDNVCTVRKEVAKRGYGLAILIEDPDCVVRAVAYEVFSKKRERIARRKALEKLRQEEYESKSWLSKLLYRYFNSYTPLS